MRLPLAAALCASLATAALASPDDAPPRVELPLGPYVRAGRPLDVRVIGGADRVRAPGTPWALPVGDRGDEFLLQMPAAVSAPLDLTVERGGRTDRVTVAVTALAADRQVVGVVGDAAAPAGAIAVRVPETGLPSVAEGWMLLDDVAGTTPALPARFASAGRWAVRARGFFEPALLPASPGLFDATAQAADRAPRLPRDTAVLLMLLGATEAALVLILAFRRSRPWAGAAWLAAPAIAASAFLVTGDRTPGALRAEATAIFAPRWRTVLVLVRVEARRTGSATFELPPGATAAAVLRYASDDTTVENVAAGSRVEMEVPAGQTRLFAYSVSALSAEQEPGDRLFLQEDESAIPRPLREWIGDAGFRRYEDGAGWYGFPSGLLPRASGTTVVAGLFALAEGVPPTK